jgi:peptidoglycan/LPS O-acetylase OafA/YrhL
LERRDHWRTAAATAHGRLPHLDGLRGIAAVAVMLFHIDTRFDLTLGFERGYLFVDLFFMLSGFVLARAWAPHRAGRADAGSLIEARIRRLWPIMALGTVLGLVAHLAIGVVPDALHLTALGLLFIPMLMPGWEIYPLNEPQWSIFWELLANLVHIAVLRRLGPRGLATLAVLFGAAAIAVIATYGTDDTGHKPGLLWPAAARVGWSYVVGMLLAQGHQASRRRPGLPWWQPLALIVLAVVILPHLPLSLALGDGLTVMVVFPVLFWLLATARPPARASGVLAALGAISFPLYAVHMSVLLMCLWLYLVLPGIAVAAVAVIASLALSACLAWPLPRAIGRARGTWRALANSREADMRSA